MSQDETVAICNREFADKDRLFTKPAVGIFDFVSASTEGIRNTTTVFDQGDIDRARLPRFISSDGVLRVSDTL